MATRTARRHSFIPLTQCAWCSRVDIFGRHLRIPGIGKIEKPLTINIPALAEIDLSVSHGICPPCAEAVLLQARNS